MKQVQELFPGVREQDGAVLHVSPASPQSPSMGASLSSTEGSSSSLQRPKGSVWVWLVLSSGPVQ